MLNGIEDISTNHAATGELVLNSDSGTSHAAMVFFQHNVHADVHRALQARDEALYPVLSAIRGSELPMVGCKMKY